MVKAATRNKLTYQEIRSALTNMYEDTPSSQNLRHHQRGFNYMMDQENGMNAWREGTDMQQEDADVFQWEDDEGWHDGAWSMEPSDWGDAAWAQTDWAEPDWQEEYEQHGQEVSTEELKALIQAQEEAEANNQNLQVMLAENDRNLAEARKAVAAAARDRGWGGGPQQGKGRPTSTFRPHGKGFSNAYPKWKNKGHEAHWFGKGKNSGKSFQQYSFKGSGRKGFQNYPKGKHQEGGSSFALNVDYELLTVDETGIFTSESSDPKTTKESLFPQEAIIDTGATASAGGQAAVTQLCAAISKVRPDTQISVFQADRPWFCYGSGRWGQALFRVPIQVPPREISIFALPSEGVPVLVGRRELAKLQVVLSCVNSQGLVMGECLFSNYIQEAHDPRF